MKTDLIVRMYNTGSTFEQIARELTMDVETVIYLYDREYMQWGSQYGYDN